MDLNMSFPGGKKVAVAYKGFEVMTDQPEAAGGEGSAPTPFDMFIIALGGCAGYFALAFCQTRGIPTEGLEVTASLTRDPETHMVRRMDIEARLPSGFPAKYKDAIVSAMKACTVVKHLDKPPVVDVHAR